MLFVERCMDNRLIRPGLLTVITLLFGVTLWSVTSSAGPGDGREPATTPPSSHQASAASSSTTPATRFGSLRPVELRTTIEIDGYPTEIRAALARRQNLMALVKELSTYPELATLADDSQKKIDRIDAALLAHAEDAADYLENRLFDINEGTRMGLSDFNADYIGLQVALERRENDSFNGFYNRDFHMLGKAVQTWLRDHPNAGPVRFQFVGRYAHEELDTGHHMAADVFIDPGSKIASIVVMDTVDWFDELKTVREGLSDSLQDYHRVITHYETMQQTICAGCKQFSMEFAREMSELPIHDEPLGRLVARLASSGGERPVELPDPIRGEDRRLGELPPQLFRLTNETQEFERYQEFRYQETGRLSIEGHLTRDEGIQQVSDVMDVAEAIERDSVTLRKTRGDLTINLLVDRSRAEGVRDVANYLNEHGADDLLVPFEQEAADVLSSEAAGRAGREQRRLNVEIINRVTGKNYELPPIEAQHDVLTPRRSPRVTERRLSNIESFSDESLESSEEVSFEETFLRDHQHILPRVPVGDLPDVGEESGDEYASEDEDLDRDDKLEEEQRRPERLLEHAHH